MNRLTQTIVLMLVLFGATPAWALNCVGGANDGNTCVAHSTCPGGYCAAVATPTATVTPTPTVTATATVTPTPTVTSTPLALPTPKFSNNPGVVTSAKRGACYFVSPTLGANSYSCGDCEVDRIETSDWIFTKVAAPFAVKSVAQKTGSHNKLTICVVNTNSQSQTTPSFVVGYVIIPLEGFQAPVAP